MISITWKEFCTWVQGKTLDREVDEERENCAGHVTRMHFHGDYLAIIESTCDMGYSELTPGSGIEPPTVQVNKL